MNKQVEQIKVEIERWKKELRLSTSCEAKYRREMLDDLSEFIEDSFQEEPVSEDLEYASEKYADNEEYGDDVYLAIKAAFKAGAKWQKEQMMKDAIPARVSFGQVVLQEKPISTSVAKDGDKVKVIIVKEEGNESN